MSLQLENNVIVALSTPEGKSALSIIRVSGRECFQIVGSILENPEVLWVAPSGSHRYCRVIDDTGHILDDVVISVFRLPHSFTGEDLCEITPHGSPAICDSLIKALCQVGCRMAEPGEFSKRAFLNGKLGVEAAEIIIAKAESDSVAELRGRELAVHQKFERLRGLYYTLIELNALIDAQIDFGDSDDIVFEGFEKGITEAILVIEQLRQSASNRSVNSAFLTVVLTGPPNVGKSSLFNTLLNYERSVVSEIPGTTRDYIEAFINIDGYKIKLIDTAGLRDTSEVIEGHGITLGKSISKSADLRLRVTDPSDRFPPIQDYDVLIHNKQDLDGHVSGLSVSAATGFGVPSLISFIREAALSQLTESSQKVVSDREIRILDEVAHKLLSVNLSTEPILIAEELHSSVESLSSLLGSNIGEDSLSSIFSRMCIGK